MRLRRFLSMFLMVICFFTIAGCYKDMQDFEKEFEDDGVFVYKKITDEKNDDYGKYAICGQVNLDLPSSVYVSPFYNGKEVVQLGYGFSSGYSQKDVVLPLFNKIDNLFFSYNCNIFNIGGGKSVKYVKNLNYPYSLDCRTGAKNIFVAKCSLNNNIFSQKLPFIISNYDRIEAFFLNKQVFNIAKNYFKNNEYSKTNYSIKIDNYFIVLANTTFYFNYEESPNEDVFFINDFERGGKIENTPYEPIREGYKFKGWYKEPECVNAWDFEEDTLPAPEYYENGELKYVETCLYAKWEKN